MAAATSPISTLPGPVREVVEHAYGTGVAEIFLVAAPLGVIAFLAVWFLQEHALGTKSGVELALEEQERERIAAGDEARSEDRQPVAS